MVMIKIPEDFKGRRTGKFKIIIIPEEKKHDKARQALLNAPVWSEEDIQYFNDNILKIEGKPPDAVEIVSKKHGG